MKFSITEYTPINTGDPDIHDGIRRTLVSKWDPGKRMAAKRALETFLDEPVHKRPWDCFGRHYTVSQDGKPGQNFVWVRESDLEDHGTQEDMEAELAPVLETAHKGIPSVDGKSGHEGVVRRVNYYTDHDEGRERAVDVLKTAAQIKKLCRIGKHNPRRCLNHHAWHHWGVSLYHWRGLDIAVAVNNYAPFKSILEEAERVRKQEREHKAAIKRAQSKKHEAELEQERAQIRYRAFRRAA